MTGSRLPERRSQKSANAHAWGAGLISLKFRVKDFFFLGKFEKTKAVCIRVLGSLFWYFAVRKENTTERKKKIRRDEIR